MTIHHATKNKAEKLGVTLSHQEDDVKAFNPNTGRFALHPEAKVALNLCLLGMKFGHEYPAIQVSTKDIGTIDFVENNNFHGICTFNAEDFNIDTIFAEALEACVEAGFDPEDGATEDDQEDVGSIVSTKYKQRYRERGNANHCGDWISQQLDGHFKMQDTETGKDVFDWKEFENFLSANGVELTGKWASIPERGGRGWAGRYRMNGRQRLDLLVARAGSMVMPNGKKVAVPTKDLNILRKKHPNWDEAETADQE